MMNGPALEAAADGFAAAFPYISLHSTGAVTSSANETSAARKAAVWISDPSTGQLTLTAALLFTGGAASGAVVRAGYWSASSGGTYGGGVLLTGDATFNAAGEYTVTAITESASSS